MSHKGHPSAPVSHVRVICLELLGRFFRRFRVLITTIVIHTHHGKALLRLAVIDREDHIHVLQNNQVSQK